MSDCEDDEALWESWPWLGKRKRKKKEAKKNSKKLQTDRGEDASRSQKKKKKKKRCSVPVKDTPAGGKEKRKEKKKTEKNVVSTQATAESPPPHAKKKLRRNKKVAFDLSPRCIRVKFPKFASSSPQLQQQDGGGQAKARWAEPSRQQVEEENSQDLFITQNTFIASPSNPSSSNTSEQTETRVVQVLAEEEREEEAGPRTGSGGQEERKRERALTREDQRPHKRENPYLATPTVLRVSQRCSRSPCTSKPRPLTALPTASVSTQTENFFTSQLSSFLSFCQQRRLLASCHDDQPLDLSRGAVCPARSSAGAETAAARGENTPSPLSADVTTSSEDNELLNRSCKSDLTQVRAVQMRLNESFFFKPKGDGHSPRAESPLMKLSQSREKKKSRKSR